MGECQSSANTECTLCLDGEEPQFLDPVCKQLAEWADLILDDDPSCHLIQVYGATHCGCKVATSEICEACDGGSLFPEPDLRLPISGLDIACGTWQNTVKISPNVTCEEQVAGIPRYCGCQNLASCSICGSGQPVRNAQAKVNEDTTCSDLDFILQEKLVTQIGVQCGGAELDQLVRELYGFDAIELCCQSTRL